MASRVVGHGGMAISPSQQTVKPAKTGALPFKHGVMPGGQDIFTRDHQLPARTAISHLGNPFSASFAGSPNGRALAPDALRLSNPSLALGKPPASAFVRTRTLLRFGRETAPATPDYQTYQLPQTDGKSQSIRIGGGNPDLLGSTWINSPSVQGVNFAIFSRGAQVELCLFNSPDDPQEALRIPLRRTGDVWHGFSPDLKPGQLYGYRVTGPYDPKTGQRFNEHKLLLDPYTKAATRPIKKWDHALLGHMPYHNPYEAAHKSTLDSAAAAPLSVVVDEGFQWEGDQLLKTPLEKTVIYEAHVKGMTALHPSVPADLRGTYAGLASPPVIDHLKSLGVTAVELLPIHFAPDDQIEKGLSNYWRYNTIGYFAPEPELAHNGKDPGGAVQEFKQMVKTLHANGLEVFLDVVFNHTAEGNEHGPTLSMRGIDNQAYYRLENGAPQYYRDYTGCGNTLDTTSPEVIRLITDSLRYWVKEMHVDGFRFDLASALARDKNGNIPPKISEHPLFKAIQADPVLSKVKLIAEPWDATDSGYKVGHFPKGWSEWNGRYRDDMRQFWKGNNGFLSAFASRLAGSSDIYGGSSRRGPFASVNFVTAHDGFTLRDLVSYKEKNNLANGENNRDGENNNHSQNFGVEGPTENPYINSRRTRQIKNFWATLLLSQGVPMILHGDELGRTQNGNNNTYCQDNETSWVHWDKADNEIQNFAKQITQLRKEHPVFRRQAFLNGKANANGRRDVSWYRPDGNTMRNQDWGTDYAKSLGVLYDGDTSGLAAKDDHFLLLANASENELAFTLPEHPDGKQWTLVLDTFDTNDRSRGQSVQAGTSYMMAPGSLALLTIPNKNRPQAKQN